MSYVQDMVDSRLWGGLGPIEVEGLQLDVYTDAGWNGGTATSKSTPGVWVELHNPRSRRSWPLACGNQRQKAMPGSTCESEMVAWPAGLRGEGLPLQAALEALLGFVAPVVCRVGRPLRRPTAPVLRSYGSCRAHIG